MTDNVNHPSHYAEGWSNGAEVIDLTENLSFNLGNAVKYACRAGKKDPSKVLEDLEKARWYITREITRLTPTVPVPTSEKRDLQFHFQLDPKAAALWNSLRPVPRVWLDITELPPSVIATDDDGDWWKYDGAEDTFYFKAPGEGEWLKADETLVNTMSRGNFSLTEVLPGE